MGNKTRAEHVAWSKERALELLESGDVDGALTSMMSDLGNHPETANHTGIQMGMALMMTGNLSTSEKMRKFIEGFN